MIRKFVFLPAILLYMGTLILAAWQHDVRPVWLNGEHKFALELLESVGIKPGMSVFRGTHERMTELLIARCTLVTTIGSDGRRKRIYPTSPCPSEGNRVTPVIYEHMIMHWTARLPYGDEESNRAALGDHFCQLADDPAVDRVLIELERHLLDYQTAERSKGLYLIGEVPCRNL